MFGLFTGLFPSSSNFPSTSKLSYQTTLLRKNWWNVQMLVTGHCNRAAVSRNRYGVEKTVDTPKILINAIKCYAMRVSASSCVAFKLSKFRLLSLLSAWSSEINPPPVITTLPSGACRMSSVAKKNAKSSLFSGKERKLGKLEGRGRYGFQLLF